MYKLLMTTLLVLTLVGCSQNQEILSYPQNISYQDDIISWDDVLNATSYIIKVNDDTHEVTTSSFNTESLPNGTYDIRIRSQRDQAISYYSPVLSITINRTYDTFDYIALIDNMILWPEVDGASSYEIYHENILLETTTEYSVDLTTLDLAVNQLYLLHVVAKYPSNDTVNSDTVIYHTYLSLNILIETTFDYNQIDDLSFNLDEQFPIDYVLYRQEVIQPSSYHYEGNTLILSSDAFQPRQEGFHYIHLLTATGFITIKIDVINNLNPVLSSSDTITYQDEDMTFTFTMNGGTFIGLSGNNITSEDYTFDEGELIISASYVERLLLENPDRSTIIIVYQLSKNSNISMGFIFINIEQ